MKKEGNYNLLRIISTIAVIMIHISATWFNDAITDIAANNLSITDIQSPFLICIYNSLPRFAVPCFVMLSGSFILDNDKNADYKKFYSKSFAKLGVPTIIFTVLYILYRIPFCFVRGDKYIETFLKDIVKGSPIYSMWYLYMLIGVYALTPIVLRFKNSISENTFYKVAFIFLVLASVSHWTTGEPKLHWDVGQSFEYLGYFMVGYSIRKMSRSKNNCKALLMILLGLLLEICAAGLEYREMIAGIAEEQLKYRIVAPYSPLIVLASGLIFYGFTLLDIKREFKRLTSLAFYIYLIHAGVWDFIITLSNILKGNSFLTELNGAVWILVFVIIVFDISCLLGKFYLCIWNQLDRKRRITG